MADGWTEWMTVAELARCLKCGPNLVYQSIVDQSACASHKIEKKDVGGLYYVRAKHQDLIYTPMGCLEALMEYYEDFTRSPTITHLAKYMGCPVRLMGRRLRALEADGYVVCVEHCWQVLKDTQGRSVRPALTWEAA